MSNASFIKELPAYEEVTLQRQITELQLKYPSARVNDQDEIKIDMAIFTVVVMDPDVPLFEFYTCSTLDRALTRAKALHTEYFNETNDTGYVVIEIGLIDESTEQERIAQWNLDDADADTYLLIVPPQETEDSDEREEA